MGKGEGEKGEEGEEEHLGLRRVSVGVGGKRWTGGRRWGKKREEVRDGWRSMVREGQQVEEDELAG